MNHQALRDLAQQALAQAKALGATGAEINIRSSQGFDVNVHQGAVDKIDYQNGHDFDLTLFRDQKKGSASTTDLSEKNIKNVVEAANSIAKLTASDEYAGLADAALMASTPMDLDLYHPWDVDVEQAIGLAKTCEATGMAVDPRISNSDGVGVSTHQDYALYANSHGFMGDIQGTHHGITCILIAKDKSSMECDYYYDEKRDAKALLSPKVIAQRAADRTIKRLNPQKLSTRVAPVIFTPELSRGLIGQFLSAISGGTLYRKASFLLDGLGKPVFSPAINIFEQPFLKNAAASAWFDADGVSTSEKYFVKNGELVNYCLGNYSAKRLGLKTTGNADGVHNLTVDSTSGDLACLLKTMDKGLLVTDALGHGANILTGDYSSGASGFWVENGEIQYPVAEITVAANLKEMFLNIVAVGNDVDRRSNIQLGSMLFEQMTIAGGA
jgi:PmbA protein